MAAASWAQWTAASRSYDRHTRVRISAAITGSRVSHFMMTTRSQRIPA
jgi:hypothetical protein